MSPARIFFLNLLVCCLVVTSACVESAEIDCNAFKPNIGKDQSIEDNFKGQAQILLKSLGAVGIENTYIKVESDALSKYPNADRLVLRLSLLYACCTLIASSTELTDHEKLEKLGQLRSLWETSPPTPQPSKMEAKDPTDNISEIKIDDVKPLNPPPNIIGIKIEGHVTLSQGNPTNYLKENKLILLPIIKNSSDYQTCSEINLDNDGKFVAYCYQKLISSPTDPSLQIAVFKKDEIIQKDTYSGAPINKKSSDYVYLNQYFKLN